MAALPRRVDSAILGWCGRASWAAGEIHAAMPDVSFGAVSLQLRTLSEAGLLDCRREHRRRFYKARRDALGPVGRHARTDVGRRAVAAEAAGGARTVPHAARGRGAAARVGLRGGVMPTLTHHLDRTVSIEAPREMVFRYFTTDDRWAAWWGPGSSIDPRPGGRVFISTRMASRPAAKCVEVRSPERVVFTFGYARATDAHRARRASRSRWSARARDRARLSPRVRRRHGTRPSRPGLALPVVGVRQRRRRRAPRRWRRLADAGSQAWTETEADARRRALADIAAPGVHMRDRFSSVEGIDESHRPHRRGAGGDAGVADGADRHRRHCQGVLLADWIAKGPDGQRRPAAPTCLSWMPRGESRA